MCNYDSFISILSDSCSVCVYINIFKIFYVLLNLYCDFADKTMHFCMRFPRTGVPTVQERDEEGIATERDYQYRYGQGPFC